MYLARSRYLRYMSGIVCIYYERKERNIARIIVKKVILKKTRTEKHTKERHHHTKNEDLKVGENVETKVTQQEVEGYQIIAENRQNPNENRIEKLI